MPALGNQASRFTDQKTSRVVSVHRSLLLLIVALGLVSAIAFSSSYQLVARFANKSVIALGLGCVGSGIVVLLLELAMGMKTRPTTPQLAWLFELTAGALLIETSDSPCALSSFQYWHNTTGTAGLWHRLVPVAVPAKFIVAQIFS